MEIRDIAKYIDHTLLKQNTTQKDIVKLCAEAKAYGFRAVCVNPCYVELAKKELEGSDVLVCTVIGFPFGANKTETKALEAKLAVEDGADELDMVINVGMLKDYRFDDIVNEIKQVIESSHHALIKVIAETGVITDDEKELVTRAASFAKADYIKTCTGYGGGGATVSYIKLIKKVAGESLKIKASGGIRDCDKAIALIQYGADRIGTSSGIEIVKQFKEKYGDLCILENDEKNEKI